MGEKRRRVPAIRAPKAAFLLGVLAITCYTLSRKRPQLDGSSASASVSAAAASRTPAAASNRRSLAEYTVDTPVRLHGRVKKMGPLGTLTMVAEGHQRNQLCFPLSWRNARLAGERRQPPSPWCVIMYNDKYKVIYLKNTKTAGTTLITYFEECSGTGTPLTDRCLRRLEYTNTTTVKRLLDQWDDYFVFSFSRNVLRRAISQYQYLSSFVSSDPRCPLISWGDYCTDPYQLGDLCYTRGFRWCCKQNAEHQYVHAAPQVDCLTTKEGASAVDWLGRTEHFDDDFADLVAVLNARGGGIPQLPANVRPFKSNYNARPCTRSGAGGDSEGGRNGGSGSGGTGSSGGTSGGGGGGGSAAVPSSWSWDDRNDTINLCDKDDYFRGPFAHCFRAISQFYEQDFALLSGR